MDPRRAAGGRGAPPREARDPPRPPPHAPRGGSSPVPRRRATQLGPPGAVLQGPRVIRVISDVLFQGN